MKWPLARWVLSFALLSQVYFSPDRLAAADPVAVSARAKLDRLQEGKAAPGSTIVFSQPELDALVRSELSEEAQLGIHDTKVGLGAGTFELSAIVDFRKIAEAGGREINSMFAKLLEGERSLKIVGALETKAGLATLRLTTVEISGIPVSGILLDLVVKAIITPVYPESKINEPFEMGHNVDHIEIQASGARVAMKK